MSEANFINKAKFSKTVEIHVQHDGLDYMDAILLTCEENGVEVETCKKYLSDSIKNKLERQVKALNLIEGDSFEPLS